MIQAFSSRAGLQDDARWHPPTPSNYYYYYDDDDDNYYYYYYYYTTHYSLLITTGLWVSRAVRAVLDLEVGL